MPCRDYPERPIPDPALQRKIDELTRMLCGICTQLDDGSHQHIRAVPGLSKWWEEHQEADRKRLAAEAAEKKRQKDEEMKQYLRLKERLGL